MFLGTIWTLNLAALAGFDTWYLFGAILEACRKYFPALRSDNAIYLFPYFLYPAHQTSIAGSIFMTVAIAFERYAAVHYPLDYNQVRNFTLFENYLKCRTSSFLIWHLPPIFVQLKVTCQFWAFLMNFCPPKMLNETFSEIFKHREFSKNIVFNGWWRGAA